METCLIRCAAEADYDRVEAIMKEVQKLHITWRPDIYKEGFAWVSAALAMLAISFLIKLIQKYSQK